MTSPPDDAPQSTEPSTGRSSNVRELHRTSEIRFVIAEIATLTERVANLTTAIGSEGARTEKRFEKVDAHFEKIDARFEKIDARFEKIDARFEKVDAHFEKIEMAVAGAVKELSNTIETVADDLHGKMDGGSKELDEKIGAEAKELGADIADLQTKATWVQGIVAGLAAAGAILTYLFHGKLEEIAVAIAKLAK